MGSGFVIETFFKGILVMIVLVHKIIKIAIEITVKTTTPVHRYVMRHVFCV